MNWISAVSDISDYNKAISEISLDIKQKLNGKKADLVILFVSSHHSINYEKIASLFSEKINTKCIIGCSAAGVIGNGHEVERRAGIAACAAYLPNVEITPFHIQQNELPNEDANPDEWFNITGLRPDNCKAMMILPDPFTIRSDNLIAGLDYAFPETTKIGALASGGGQPGSNALFINNKSYTYGAVGVGFSGDLSVETIVAQGCRPIGEPMIVTDADINVINKIGDKTPLEILGEIFEKSSIREKRLIRRSLQIGIIMDRFSSVNDEEFLIRNILGADEEDGSIAIGEMINEGQIIQFYIRDAKTADEDLKIILEKYADKFEDNKLESALLFSCLGRGQYLYGAPNHDTNLFANIVGDIPITGFFSNGEIGSIGDQTFLHGYTSSFALFKSEKQKT
ncbi:MAG: hypothetical protein FI675_01185 [SAR202 cluster bacterium]|nr:hypothetical protein [SAR202 cluster bacterium]